MPTSSPPSKIISILPSMSSLHTAPASGLVCRTYWRSALQQITAAQIKRCAMESDEEPHRYCIQTSCRFFGYKRVLFKIIVRGPGQKRCQTFCDLRHRIRDFVNIFPPADVHDQRVVGRPSLRRIYFPRRFRIQRISAQSVDRLCRKRHQPAGFDDLARPKNRFPSGCSLSSVTTIVFMLIFSFSRKTRIQYSTEDTGMQTNAHGILQRRFHGGLQVRAVDL